MTDTREVVTAEPAESPGPGTTGGEGPGDIEGDGEYAYLQPLLLRYAGAVEEDLAWTKLRERLVTGFLPIAQHLARRYYGRGVPLEDLSQVASIGLINAIDRFDPSWGRGFLAFAVPTIQGELRRYFRDRTWSMHVPRRLKELHVRISAAHVPLAQQLGRAPRPSELAAHLGVPVEEILEGLQAGSSYNATSLDSTLEGAEADGESLGGQLGHLDPDLELVEVHQSLKPLLESLPDRERTILIMRFYREYTQSQIGERLGVSQMHVSRLLSSTLAQLREQLFAEG